MHRLIYERDQVHDRERQSESSSQAPADEVASFRKRRRIWQARRIQDAKLLAFLLVFQIRGHLRLLALFQQIIVEVLRRLIASSNFFQLLFDDGTSLQTPLQLCDLVLYLSLPLR